MGHCVSCGKPFLWFSGTQDQRCGECVEKSNALPMRRVFRLDVGGEDSLMKLKKGISFVWSPLRAWTIPILTQVK